MSVKESILRSGDSAPARPDAVPLWMPQDKLHESTIPVTFSATPHDPWGIDDFDYGHGGLVAGAYNMLATPDHDAAVAAIGHFLARGLRDGRRAVLVGFDNPRLILAKLEYYGFDYAAALESEQLIYLYYKPAFFHALSCSTDYTILFAEIRRLAGEVSRLAFLNADMLFNLQSEYLAHVTAAKLAAAAGAGPTTVLGCFVHQRIAPHWLLDATCANLMPGYLVMRSVPRRAARCYAVKWRKGPGACGGGAILLTLEAGRGYVGP